jgi:hypothetical protein
MYIVFSFQGKVKKTAMISLVLNSEYSCRPATLFAWKILFLAQIQQNRNKKKRALKFQSSKIFKVL